MLKIMVGVIGCGAIGTEICEAIDEDERLELKFLIDRHRERVEEMYKKLRKKPSIVGYDSTRLDEFLEETDLVIECASQSAVREFVIPALKKGKDVMIMSVGALVDEELFEEIEKESRKRGSRVHIPSGAIIGLDGLKAAATTGSLYSIRLTTRKSPASFRDNEYVKRKGINLSSLKNSEILLCGNVKEAVRYFPENINVAAALSIAGIGWKKTEVKIIVEPYIVENVHEIEAEGEFGRFFAKVENVFLPSNPKTSHLAALSAIATLRGISHPIKIGT